MGVAKATITSEPTSRDPGSALLDRARIPRLLMSLALAGTLLAGAAFVLSRVKPAAPEKPRRKTTVAISLTEPAAPKPPPPAPTVEAPDPAPDAAPTRPEARPASRSRGPTPVAASTAPATTGGNGDPGTDDGTDPYAGGLGPSSPGPVHLPAAAAPPPPPSPPPRPPPAPEAKKPVRVTDDVEPPVAISMSPPPYPASAKAAGVEGTVVIQYVVTESGSVTSVQVVKGPPELTRACLAAVAAWRFKPARSKGAPISVVRQARFPFKIRT